MVVIRFRSNEEHEHMLKKLKRMNKFTDELIDCFEDKVEDDDESYRYNEDDEDEWDKPKYRTSRMRRRRSM